MRIMKRFRTKDIMHLYHAYTARGTAPVLLCRQLLWPTCLAFTCAAQKQLDLEWQGKGKGGQPPPNVLVVSYEHLRCQGAPGSMLSKHPWLTKPFHSSLHFSVDERSGPKEGPPQMFFVSSTVTLLPRQSSCTHVPVVQAHKPCTHNTLSPP